MSFRVRRKSNKKTALRRTLFILSFIAIPVAHFLIFYVYVNFSGILMAFQKPENGQYVFAGFDNFVWVFKRIFEAKSTGGVDDLKLAFINTFKTFLIQIIMFFVGFFVSYFLYKKIKGHKLFRVIFYLPAIISPIVISYFYSEFVNSKFFSTWLQNMFNLPNPVEIFNDEQFANFGIFLQIIWLSFPANMILWSGAFSRIPTSVIEAAKIDGCGWFREIFSIVLPLVWPTFVLLLTTNLATIFAATGNVFLLTGGDFGTQTIANWMFQKVQTTPNPYGSDILNKVSAMGLLLTIISCTIAILVRKFINKKYGEVQY